MSIYGNYVEESYIINEKDIFYHKKQFDNNDINLCFITGLSGSGKSTLAGKMENKSIEKYELDDVFANYNFSNDNLKEYGDLIYSFFIGIGKKYRMTEEPSENNNWLDNKYTDKFEEGMCKDFIKHSIQYSKSHKNTKFIIEGVELYWFIQPEELKEYAVYIKGTSQFLSRLRGSIRDSNDSDSKLKRLGSIFKNMSNRERAKAFSKSDKVIRKWRKYYIDLINKESKSV